jgi:hypothetical protein
VTLRTPARRPLLFRYIEGWLSTSPKETGVLVPILDQASEKTNIRIKNATGDFSREETLAPDKMIVLSADVLFELSASVILVLYLHPT